MYHQGDIVLVNFPLPKGFKPHPAIIISCKDVYESEDCYVGLMITSSIIQDNFTFNINNEMLINPLDKPSQVRCQLIALFHEDEIQNKLSKLKKEYFLNLIKQLNNNVFGVDI